MTIGACFSVRAACSPDHIGVEYGEQSYTWKELDEISDYMAIRMHLFGMKAGDHVGIWSVNTPNWIITFLALEKIGAIPVMINTCYKEKELSDVIGYADIKYMYYGDGYKSFVYESLIEKIKGESWCQVKRWISIGREPDGRWLSKESFYTAEKNKKQLMNLAKIKQQVCSKDIAGMLFTSGTTSVPKGVLLSHDNLVGSARATAQCMGWGERDKQLLAVPLFHCFGITSGLLASICAGCTIHLVDYFKTRIVLAAIETYGCTVLNGVPSMFLAMSRSPLLLEKKHNLDSLQSGIIAGSPVSVKEYQNICECIKSIDLRQSYGQTETSPCVTLASQDDLPVKKAGTVGKAVPDVEIRICNYETQEVLASGQIGEIQVRGYNVMQGYYKRPEETRRTIGEDGWIRTGDLGYLDEEDYLCVAGRKKDMIIRGGENISPQEIEACIKDMGGVLAVKVIGIPTEVLQEMIVACVVMEPGKKFSEQGILSYLTPKLAHYKIPAHVLQMERLPMSASGKVLIPELKKRVISKLNIK